MAKIVITGIGAVTPLGNSYGEICEKFRVGVSGITLSSDKTTHCIPTHHAGYVSTFGTISHTNLKSRLAQLTLSACFSALKDAGLDDSNYLPHRKALVIGSEPASIDLKGQLPTLEKLHNGELSIRESVEESGLFPEKILSEVCRLSGIQGRSYFHLGTCSAAAQAIGEAKFLLENNIADIVLCGGSSSRVDPLSMLRLIRVGALAPTTSAEAATLCMPFDRRRQGFTMGEGAIMFVLERMDSARVSERKPYAFLSGYGAALDGYSITDPHPEELGMKLCMQRALDDADIKPEAVDYINAHGTSTQKNDFHETRAIHGVFKKHAYNVSVSSTKSMHGHLMSAAGAIELIASIATVREQFIPPTLNYVEPDPECDLDYTPNLSVKRNVKYALSNSFGLGGQNASLVVKRFE